MPTTGEQYNPDAVSPRAVTAINGEERQNNGHGVDNRV